ncbi:MAG: aspartate/glutamate racemase family protein, partial [Bdellovibrionales bacterium]|nr:aspartate/glutamate racemase family protein [Bdellovibrionales bacterium]
MGLPVGVFDSGLGGLTVLKALMEEFPNQEFIYLGDTARLPYGNKSPSTLQRFVRQNVKWMEQRRVQAIVVACNSASTVLPDLANVSISVPIFDVILPGAEAGVAASKSGHIAVMATRATVTSNAYEKAIHQIDPRVRVDQIECPLLAPL